MNDWYCRCGATFRSATAEARHRHNFPLLCRKPKLELTEPQAAFVAALEKGPARLMGRVYIAHDGQRLRARTVELKLSPKYLRRESHGTCTWAVSLSSTVTGYESFKREFG